MPGRPEIDLVRPMSLASWRSLRPARPLHAGDPSTCSRRAGACPIDGSGATVARGDLAAQSVQVMDNLSEALQAAGAELGDVVKTTVYVASAAREDLVSVWQVVRNRFGDHDPPSTLLGVSVLGYPGQLVEVEAVAALPGS